LFRLKMILCVLCIFLAGLAPAISSCRPAAVPDIPARSWKMSVVTNEDSSWAKGAHLFAELVKQRTNGRIQITVYPDGELANGDQVEELNMLQEGDINFTYHSNLLYTNLDQSFAAVSMPWLFADYFQVDAALSGPAGSQLLQAAEDLGIVGLAYGENGFRQLTNDRLAVSTPEDLHGLKIRIPDVDLYHSIYTEMGAIPVTMDFGEVISALEQGQIDGQENPIDIIVSSRLYEVQQHITIWNYSYDAIILGMNKKDWDGLPGTAQEIIRLAAIEASREQVQLSRHAAEDQLGLLREKGMTITELTPDQIEAFRTTTDPVYAEWSGSVDIILNEIEGS